LKHLLTDCQRWRAHREQCMGAALSMIAGMGVGSMEEKMILTTSRTGIQWKKGSTLATPSIDSETTTCGAFQ